jgi:succinoglycan biosynthesis transport protein ExoP
LTERPDDRSVLRDWFSLLRSQRLIVLTALVLVPLFAFTVSRRQQHLYQASATVLVNEQNPVAQALNRAPAVTTPPDRYAATEAKLARVGTVAAMAVKEAGVPNRTASDLLANSSVSADLTADLLTFSVTDPVPNAARKLATAYARQFTQYRHKLDNSVLAAAIADTRRKLDAHVVSGGGGSPMVRQLSAIERDLEELQALQPASSGAAVVDTAGSAALVRPRTKRDIMLGVIVGLALGIALALIREALDTRVRSADELSALLGVPLLGSVPLSSRHRAESQRPATLSEPTGSNTDAFRRLAQHLRTLQLEHEARSIVITSPGDDEDKSAAVANLAVALAESGRHVILVDLNLRNPRIDRLFGLRARFGFSDLAKGVDLTRALTVVDVPNTHRGSLEILTSGHPPRDPGEFLLSDDVPGALVALKSRCDALLIDSPPASAAGDAAAIATYTDAVILVAAVNRLRRETLIETRRMLDGCRAQELGVIATAGSPIEPGGYLQRARSALTGMYVRRVGSAAPHGRGQAGGDDLRDSGGLSRHAGRRAPEGRAMTTLSRAVRARFHELQRQLPEEAVGQRAFLAGLIDKWRFAAPTGKKPRATDVEMAERYLVTWWLIETAGRSLSCRDVAYRAASLLGLPKTEKAFRYIEDATLALGDSGLVRSFRSRGSLPDGRWQTLYHRVATNLDSASSVRTEVTRINGRASQVRERAPVDGHHNLEEHSRQVRDA